MMNETNHQPTHPKRQCADGEQAFYSLHPHTEDTKIMITELKGRTK